MIQIQSVLIHPDYKTSYWKKDGDNKPKRISKAEWFQLYNLPDTKVLPPITKERI